MTDKEKKELKPIFDRWKIWLLQYDNQSSVFVSNETLMNLLQELLTRPSKSDRIAT